ncbi:MAG: phosphoglycerate dehydrogenase [Firmicutes bacterium]|nr:phosphoglycerate dehydrogenase [Bacillota bacterium]
MTRPRILVTEPLAAPGLNLLREVAQVEVMLGLSTPALVQKIPEYDALITRNETQVTREVILSGKKLQVIGRAGVGFDSIDLAAATAAGIPVLNVPNGNTTAAAEHTMALLLALIRHLPQAYNSLRAGEWQRRRFVGSELRGKTLGIIGLGRIGSEVAKRARAFGMSLVTTDPYIRPEKAERLGARLVPLPELLREADLITLHVPKTADTYRMIGQRELELVKKTARILNCARGGLIDEAALHQALVKGQVAGAALDVFEEEPPRGNPLLELPNVIYTPHLGGSTQEAQEANSAAIAEQVLKVLSGQEVVSAVNLPQIPEDSAHLRELVHLSEVLGGVHRQAIGGRIRFIEVSLRSEREDTPLGILTNAALKGLLSGTVDTPINLINAPHVAATRGIEVVPSEAELPGPVGFADRGGEGDLLRLRLGTERGMSTVAGTLTMEGELKLLELDGYPVDMTLTPYMLVTSHIDQPGVIGQVGTILGQHGVNIAAMQVGRRQPRGEARMILEIDSPTDEVALAALQKVRGMIWVKQIKNEVRPVTWLAV